MLFRKNLNFLGFNHQVGEFAFKTGGPYNVVVDPVVIAAARLAKKNAVVLKAVFEQPCFGYLPVRFGAAGEKVDNMPFIVPFVEHGNGIGVG